MRAARTGDQQHPASQQHGDLVPTVSPSCATPQAAAASSSPSALRAEICLFSSEKKKAQDSPQWKHHLAMALGKLAASPGFPIPGFFPFLVFFPIETANSGDAGPGAGGFPGALQAPSLAQPSSPSPPYCSNSTRHGYKNKTAM